MNAQRMTNGKRKILQVLEGITQPLTAMSIMRELESEGTYAPSMGNLVTTLKTMVSQGLIVVTASMSEYYFNRERYNDNTFSIFRDAKGYTLPDYSPPPPSALIPEERELASHNGLRTKFGGNAHTWEEYVVFKVEAQTRESERLAKHHVYMQARTRLPG